jgi:AAHS family 4-hydroxybenzoate transporter-like MFS transporter
LAPAAAIDANAQFEADGSANNGIPFLKLFSEGRALGTLALWGVNFMNLLNLYFLSNWLPTLVRDSGYSAQTATLMGATLQLAGTIGSLLLAWIVSRSGLAPALAAGFCCGAVAIALIGQPALPLGLLYIVVSIAGMGIVGGQGGVNALAATLYPTDLRASGVGAGLGVGRIGAIVGPTVAGQLLAQHWSNQQLFLAAAVPAAISTILMAVMPKLAKEQRS